VASVRGLLRLHRCSHYYGATVRMDYDNQLGCRGDVSLRLLSRHRAALREHGERARYTSMGLRYSLHSLTDVVLAAVVITSVFHPLLALVTIYGVRQSFFRLVEMSDPKRHANAAFYSWFLCWTVIMSLTGKRVLDPLICGRNCYSLHHALCQVVSIWRTCCRWNNRWSQQSSTP